MTDIELLPLPKKAQLANPYASRGVPTYGHSDETLTDYARANVAHATAAKDAEIERLRAEVRELRKRQAGWERHVAAAGCEYVRDGEHDALVNRRAERLAEALRGMVSVFGASGLYEKLFDLARAALRDHDQEVGNG